MLVLDEQDVSRCLEIEAVIGSVSDTLAAYARGEVVAPVRAEVRAPEDGLLGLFMPAYLPSLPSLGQKTVVESEANHGTGLPALSASLVLHDATTGHVQALLAATALTNLRTGAIAAVAARHLAPPDARSATLLGTGGIAPALARAVHAALGLEQLVVWGRRPERATDLADGLRSVLPEVEVIVASDPVEAVRDAPVVLTATSASEPLFPVESITRDALVCCMGSNAPTMCEVPPELLGQASRVLADTRAGVIPRAGEVVRALTAGHLGEDDIGELGAVVGGSAPSRQPDEAVIVVKSCGFAALDVALGSSVLEQARAKGLGTKVAFDQSPVLA